MKLLFLLLLVPNVSAIVFGIPMGLSRLYNVIKMVKATKGIYDEMMEARAKDMDKLTAHEIAQLDGRMLSEKSAFVYTTVNLHLEEDAKRKYNAFNGLTGFLNLEGKERWDRMEGEFIILNKSEAAAAKYLFNLSYCALSDPNSCKKTATALFSGVIERIDSVNSLQSKHKDKKLSPAWKAHVSQIIADLDQFKDFLNVGHVAMWEKIKSII